MMLQSTRRVLPPNSPLCTSAEYLYHYSIGTDVPGCPLPLLRVYEVGIPDELQHSRRSCFKNSVRLVRARVLHFVRTALAVHVNYV